MLVCELREQNILIFSLPQGGITVMSSFTSALQAITLLQIEIKKRQLHAQAQVVYKTSSRHSQGQDGRRDDVLRAKSTCVAGEAVGRTHLTRFRRQAAMP